MATQDNFHVNAFVRRLFDRIAADPQRFAPFFVRRCADPAAPPTLFIDPAVYTRNRCGGLACTRSYSTLSSPKGLVALGAQELYDTGENCFNL